MESREFDVVILGASGFTGKYVVREALKFLSSSAAPGSPLKTLALAGRNPTKLSQALAWASSPSPPPPLPIIPADVSSPSSLLSIAARARILLNCVGPFRLYGAPVVSACVEAGTDYLDISGEPAFMERMEADQHGRAVKAGSLVVSACGFDSVPAELGVMFNSRQWAGPAVPNSVEAYLVLESEKRIVGNFGTFESAVLEVANAAKLQDLWRPRPRMARPANYWASVKPAHFGVKLGLKSLMGVLWVMLIGLFIRVFGMFSFGRSLLLKYPEIFSLGGFRKTGPTEEVVRSATFKMWFVGHGYSDASIASQGPKKPDTEIITMVSGPEIWYLTTPIILVQCALILLSQRHNLPKGGVLPPGIVFGPTDLQQRLQENGISFEVISKKTFVP